MTRQELTAAQERALRVFAGLTFPSLEEWAVAVGVCYTTILHHRRELVRKGYLQSVPGKARSTALTDKARALLAGGATA